jgi:hypothetical protein
MRGNWGLIPRARKFDWVQLAREAAAAKRQVLLSFVGDPYCGVEKLEGQTRRVLELLGEHGCSVAILTKGGDRVLRDLDLFKGWPGGRIKVGMTLTFARAALARTFEPMAPAPWCRIETLDELAAAGVRTWASIEPVIYEDESLAAIEWGLASVDGYMVGMSSGMEDFPVDWGRFVVRAVEMIRRGGRKVYVKEGLRKYAPVDFLRAEECDADAHFVGDRI